MTVDQYFQEPDRLRPMELIYGRVCEPPAPRYGHQSVVTRLTTLLDSHVRDRGLGAVCVSPIDVVLDRRAALVVQPDLVFISAARIEIISERIWGAPDLAVEVLSPGTAHRDRTTKLRWYRRYGVRECWLVDPQAARVEVCPLEPPRRRRTYTSDRGMRSHVLPAWHIPPAVIFD